MSSFGVSADESEDTWASFDEIELDGGYNSVKDNRGDQFVPGSVTQGWMSTGKRTERNFSQQKQVLTDGLNKTKEVVRRESNGWDMEDSDGGNLLLEVPGVDSSATEEEWGLRQTTPVGDGAVLLCNSRSKRNETTEDRSAMEVMGFAEGRVAEQRGVKESTLGERAAEGFEDLSACREGGTTTAGRSFAEPRNSSQTMNTYTTDGGSDTITEDLDSYLLGEGLDAGVWGEEGLEYSWDSINNLGNVNELFGGKMSLEGMRRSKSPPSPTGGGGGEGGGGTRGRLKIIVGQDQDDMGWMGMDLADDVLGVGPAQGLEQGGMMDEGEDWKMGQGSPEMGQEERGGEFEMEMDGEWGEGRYKEDMILEGDVGSGEISGGSNQVRSSSGWPATELPEEGLAVSDLLPGDMLGRQEAQTARKQQMLHKRKDEMLSGGQQRKAVQMRSSSPSAAAMNPAVQGQAASPVGAETPVLMMPPKRQGRQSFGQGSSSGTQATTGGHSEGVPQFMPMPVEGGGHMAGGGCSSSRAPGVSAQQQPAPPRRQHLQQQHQQQQQQLRAQFQQQQQQLQLQQRQQQQLLNQQQRQQLTVQGTYQVRPSTPVPVSRGNRGMAHQQQQVYYPYQPQSAMGYPGVRGPQVMQAPPHQGMPPGMMVGPRVGGGMWGQRPMGMMPQSPSPPPMWEMEPQGTMVASPGIVPVGESSEVGGVAAASAAAAAVGSPAPEGEEDESVEGKVLKQLDRTMRALDVGTQLCIRDALYRLARSARERRKSTEQSSSGASGCGEPMGEGSTSGTGSQANNNTTTTNSNNNTTPPGESQPTSAASEPSMESGVPSTAAADMNAIDRSIVSLLFHLRKPRSVPVGAEPMLHPAPMPQQIPAVGGGPGSGPQYMVNPMVPQPMGQGPYPMGMGPGPMMPVAGPGPMGSWGWQHQGGGPVMAPMPARGGMQMMGPPAGVMVPTGMGMMGSMGMPPASPMGPPRPILSRRTRLVPGGTKGGMSGPGRGAWPGGGGAYAASAEGRSGRGVPGGGVGLGGRVPAVSSSSGSSKMGSKMGSSKGSTSGRSLASRAMTGNAGVPSGSSGAESGNQRGMVGVVAGMGGGEGGEVGTQTVRGVMVKQEEGVVGGGRQGETYAGPEIDEIDGGDESGERVDYEERGGGGVPLSGSEGMRPLPPDR